MFFSPVVSNGISPGALGFLRSNGNLFNVAITRARGLLHVVGDCRTAVCLRDQLRNQRLIELGWDVQRFWVYEFATSSRVVSSASSVGPDSKGMSHTPSMADVAKP